MGSWGNKGLCHCCRSHWFRWNLIMETCISSCCLWSVVILKYLLYLCAGFPWLFSNWKHSCSPIFSVWQLAPASNTIDKDWHRLNLLTDSRCTSLETKKQIWKWLGKLPHLTTNSTLLAAAAVSNMAEQLQPQLPSHGDTVHKKCYQRDFKKLHNQNSIDSPMKVSKALFVANSKLSMNAHLVQICKP